MVRSTWSTLALYVSTNGVSEKKERCVAEEVPVALAYNGSTHAVMMATPMDLVDFAVGFSLSEGIITNEGDVELLDIIEHDIGIELRMWLSPKRAQAHIARRRTLTGPTGCGLCGVDSLVEALPELPRVGPGIRVRSQDIRNAIDGLLPLQVLNRQTGALHGAGFWRPDTGVALIREDVGRHNALDKLAGALHRDNVRAAEGIITLTSRVSVELIQKAATTGATIVAAISAPTALAIRAADASGITLVAVARRNAFEVFSHPHRIEDCINAREQRVFAVAAE